MKKIIKYISNKFNKYFQGPQSKYNSFSDLISAKKRGEIKKLIWAGDTIEGIKIFEENKKELLYFNESGTGVFVKEILNDMFNIKKVNYCLFCGTKLELQKLKKTEGKGN